MTDTRLYGLGPGCAVCGEHLGEHLLICSVARGPEPRQLTLDEQHLVEDILTALRTGPQAAPGQPPVDHRHMLTMDLLQALVEVAEMRGDRATARRHVQKRLELQRAHAAGQGA